MFLFRNNIPPPNNTTRNPAGSIVTRAASIMAVTSVCIIRILRSGDFRESPDQEPDSRKDQQSRDGIGPDYSRRPDNADAGEDQERPDEEQCHVRASRLKVRTLPGFHDKG